MTSSGEGSAGAHSLNELVKQHSTYTSALLLVKLTYILYKMLKFVKQINLDFGFPENFITWYKTRPGFPEVQLSGQISELFTVRF